MIVRVSGIRISFDEGEKMLSRRVAELLSVPVQMINSLKVLKKSLDARRARPPFLVYVVEAAIPDTARIPDALGGEIAIRVVEERGRQSVLKDGKDGKKDFLSYRHISQARAGQQVIVVGSGPAGLFAALTLAEGGVPVLLLERGKEVSERLPDVHAFWEKGVLNGESNVHFGEGGAGAFSDGKLTSRAKHPLTGRVKETLVECGAQADILIDAKPHIGTDRLRGVVVNFREKLLGLGCEIRFGARASDFLIEKEQLAGLIVNEKEEIRARHLILAMGQHADDTYRKLRERGVPLAPKPFALGLRVEHPQPLIDEIQYGRWRQHPDLPPADYFLTARTSEPVHSVYTFCMCPGGQIIGCSSEAGGVITNGMSRSLRDGPYANSAAVVNVGTEDFLGTPQRPLAGLFFRRRWEERAFSLGGGDYSAPAQRLLDFLHDRESGELLPTSYLPRVKAAPLREALPPFVGKALKEGFHQFERKMPGFITEAAMLVGVETRTSSPVRILRDARGQSVGLAGLYPCGEGAGYAGGIVSSALDGIRAAENVLIALGGHLLSR